MNDIQNMVVGKRYIVTKKSKDNTFRKGDHIQRLENGDIQCNEAGGWIELQHVFQATKGMTYELDLQWMTTQIAKLEAELKFLKETV